MRVLSTVAALLLLAALPAAAFELPWGGGKAEPAPMPPRPIVSEIVSASDDQDRSIPGAIAAKNQVTLGFQTLGRVVQRDVDLGDEVASGQLLARLDPEDLTGDVRAAQASLDAVLVQLSTAEATAERVRALAARNVASEAQLEQAEQALASAQAAVDQAQSELLRAQDTAGYTDLTAPFAGVISEVYENAGAVVQAGAPIVQLSAEDEQEALIDLPEAALATLPQDPSFLIWQENTPEVTVRATIDRIDPMADSATRTRRLHLALEEGAHFRLGALIRARLNEEEHTQLTLPDAAVLVRDGDEFVWRVSRDGAAASVSLVPVDTEGLLNGRLTVISGIGAGDEIVTRGIHSLTDGQQVGRRVAP